jgi:hypothetical protein
MRIGLQAVRIWLAATLLCSLAAAQETNASSNAKSQPSANATSDPLAELRKRAESAEGGDRARLFIELAHHEIEAADAKFTAGDADRAQAEIKQATADAAQATQASLKTHKRMKQTQIAVHELARRLDGIEHSLTAEDRPPVRAAAEKLQNMATELLETMFKRK